MFSLTVYTLFSCSFERLFTLYAAFIIPYPTVIIAIILAILLVVRLRSVSKKQKEDMQSFWDREREAAVAPSVNLDSLPYITIPLDKFPLGLCESEEAAMIEDELKNARHPPPPESDRKDEYRTPPDLRSRQHQDHAEHRR